MKELCGVWTAQIVRTVQKASCGDIKNLKRSGAVCEPLPVKRTAKKYKVSPASSIRCWPLFSVPGMGDFTKKKRLFAGVRKISSEVQKSSCIVHRCTVYDFIAKKREAKWHVGRSRSGDISCRKKDVSCRQPRKARKICYTERRKLENCPGAPPDP